MTAEGSGGAGERHDELVAAMQRPSPSQATLRMRRPLPWWRGVDQDHFTSWVVSSPSRR